MESTEIIILAGALLGGYVSGLTGFGTGLTALPIWLVAVQPLVAGPIVVICSIVGQLLTLPSIWKFIAWQRIMPFLLSALVGVPIGTLFLSYFTSENFRLTIGFLLIFYSSIMLLRRSTPFVISGGRISDAVVGLCGGILGGVAGLSGVLPTIWVSLRNWKKDTKRGFFQGFNLVVLCFSALSMWMAGYLTVEVERLVLIALPGTLLGVWLGRKTYNKLDDTRFDTAVLFVFLFSGILIIAFWLGNIGVSLLKFQ